MNFLAPFRIALRALAANTLRSILTMLGIIIGVAAVIAMVGVGAGATARIQEQIQSIGSNLIIVMPGSLTSGGMRLGSGAGCILLVYLKGELKGGALEVRAQKIGVVRGVPTGQTKGCFGVIPLA